MGQVQIHQSPFAKRERVWAPIFSRRGRGPSAAPEPTRGASARSARQLLILFVDHLLGRHAAARSFLFSAEVAGTCRIRASALGRGPRRQALKAGNFCCWPELVCEAASVNVCALARSSLSSAMHQKSWRRAGRPNRPCFARGHCQCTGDTESGIGGRWLSSARAASRFVLTS